MWCVHGKLTLDELDERWCLAVNGRGVRGLAIPVRGDKPASRALARIM
jgi:hypothetical protein